MTASLLFLGLNPLFVLPRDDTIQRQQSIENNKSNKSLKKKGNVAMQKQISKNKKQISKNNATKHYVNKNVIISPKRNAGNKSIMLQKSKSISKSKSKSKSKSYPKEIKSNQYTISSKLYNNNSIGRKYTNKSNISSETSISISEEISDITDVNLYQLASDNVIEKEMMYLILTQQKNEAIEQCKTLEILLSQNHKTFKMKCDEFKKQLKEYKNTNNYLQIENNKLKTDIQQLKDKLKTFNTQNNTFESLLWKRRKNIKNKYNQQQLPNFVKKDYKHINNINNNKPKAKKQNKNKNNKPFITRHNSNESCESLTVLPPLTPLTPLTHVRHLTTILEDNTVPLQLLTLQINHSTENNNIDQQWINDSIASIVEEEEEEKEKEKEEEEEEYEYESSVSYMSNNTIILNELSNNHNNKLNKLNKIHIGSISNMSLMEYDHMCDDKVESPIKLDSDYSFNVTQV